MQRFSASSASKHMACHASANLELAIPGFVEPPRVYGGAAQAGTDVHKVIEDLMAIRYVTASRTAKFNASDMIAAGKMLGYIGEVWSRRRFSTLNEAPGDTSWLQTQPKTTADLVFYTQDEIHVLDPKWGKVRVEVRNNKQLMFYAASFAHLAPKAKGVTVHIVQPRLDNMEEWFIPAHELATFMQEAKDAEAAILAGDTSMNPGDHCTFCPANPHSRGGKGSPSCPEMLNLLGYAPAVDESAMLADL